LYVRRTGLPHHQSKKRSDVNNSSHVPISDSPVPESALTNTIRLLARLGRERFYGKLTIEYKDGVIVVIRREETIKPI
jgi:hypothetical protein